jgi:hypothetical protein
MKNEGVREREKLEVDGKHFNAVAIELFINSVTITHFLVPRQSDFFPSTSFPAFLPM